MESFLILLAILFIALLLDLILGEPLWQWRIPLHPTVLINKFVKKILPAFRDKNPKIEKFKGVLLVLFVVASTTLTAYFLLYIAKLLYLPVYLIVAAAVLKFTLCVKLETEMAGKAEKYVKEQNLEEGRKLASLFSRRNTDNLNEKQIVSAVIESMAENLADFKLSPMFYYAIFGVSGAVAFKTINILDGTVGFRDREHVNIGWFSAMADTVVNFPISRLSALFIVLAALFIGESPRNAWRIMLRDYKKVPSINHGWPMTAMAGALNVQLEKPGYYAIGEMKNELSHEHIYKALKIRNIAIVLFMFLIELPLMFLSSVFLGVI